METARTLELASVAPLDSMLQEQLFDRRKRLRAANEKSEPNSDLLRLLGEVDAALSRFEKGTYGLCEECHDPIEAERLLADPLMRVCLGDLTDKQRHALEDDLQLAFDIQKGLLPKYGLSCESWNVDFIYEPAGVVSGDYVDVVRHDGELYFVLGDVSGKGMAASLLMSNLHATFHSLIPLGLGVCETMVRANRLLSESSLANQYATLVFGRANSKGEIEICNAGHLPPILIKNGVKGELNHAGLPLGMFADTAFSSSRVKLAPGDSLLVFSDGVTEAMNEMGTEFGISRLMESIGECREHHPADLIGVCLESVNGFRGSAARNDDLTMMALKFTGAAI